MQSVYVKLGVSEVECETMALSETTGNFDFMV